MTTDIEPTVIDPYETIRVIEEVGLLHLKGYKNSEIAEVTSLAPATIRKYIKDYKIRLEREVEDDPYFLEKVQYNTLQVLAEMGEISKEAWESVDIATREGMVGQRTTALKLALDVAGKKAQLLQLMGGQKTDGEYIARMQKAEQVNQVISKIIHDIIAECDVCRPKAEANLREAFALMDLGQDHEDGDSDVVEAELIEE